MELEMREVGAAPLQNLHGFERRGHISRVAKVVAVKVERVWQPEVVDDLREAGDDRGRRQLLVALDRPMKQARVLSPLPGRDTARVDGLDSVDLGGPNEPGNHVLSPLQLAGLDQVQHDLVVGHEHQTRFVHDGRVVELLVRVLG
jgi:hypothetical protein